MKKKEFYYLYCFNCCDNISHLSKAEIKDNFRRYCSSKY